MWGWAPGSPTTSCRITNSRFHLQHTLCTHTWDPAHSLASALHHHHLVGERANGDTLLLPLLKHNLVSSRINIMLCPTHVSLSSPKTAVQGHAYCGKYDSHTIYFVQDKHSSWHHRTDLAVCVSYTCFPLVLPSVGNKEVKVVAIYD